MDQEHPKTTVGKNYETNNRSKNGESEARELEQWRTSQHIAWEMLWNQCEIEEQPSPEDENIPKNTVLEREKREFKSINISEEQSKTMKEV